MGVSLKSVFVCRAVVAGGVLVVAGWGLSWVGRPAGEWQGAHQPAFRAESLEGVLGQGALLGVFGGFRAIMADFAWLRSYVSWERCERAGCETFMRMALTLDPGNAVFWLDGGYITAFDMPHWEVRTREAGGRLKLDAVVVRQIKGEYARRGLALLSTGAERHPARAAEFWERCAMICLNVLKEPERAAEFYRRAAECENPKWYASLAYANLLALELGRKEEARRWLEAYAEKFRRGERRDTGRIRELLDEVLREWGTATPPRTVRP
ncbi:MAG: hypothetical protein LBD14_05890 [Puniceicoccales bacterium]|jgi:tetratricopeptide (TPR) repeat protein|nr:hypothetical protein [Puniceicoccales bacterium]